MRYKYSDDREESARIANKLKMQKWRAKNPGANGSSKRAKEKYRREGKAKARMRKQKGLLVETFGGKCQCCGGEFHHAELDFHHIDKTTKERPLQPDRAWTTLVNEAAKCVMLCSNCHRLYHYFERNQTCSTLLTHPLLPVLRLLLAGHIVGPSLTELLKAGAMLSTE